MQKHGWLGFFPFSEEDRGRPMGIPFLLSKIKENLKECWVVTLFNIKGNLKSDGLKFFILFSIFKKLVFKKF